MLVNEIINAKDLPVMEFDGIIVGGGGAGMRASLQLAESGLNTAVISKVFLPAHIRSLLKEGSLVLFKAMILMTGDGICLILSKALIT